MTLSSALFPSRSLGLQAALVLAGSGLIAVAAQVEVPMWPAPITLQTLAVLLVGFTLGARLGAAAVVAYLLEGAAGLPVFAGGASGAAFAGPTAGFLVGFVPMAWLAGFAADRGARSLWAVGAVALACSALLYLPGAAWAMAADAALGLDATTWGADNPSMIWQYYVQPFLIGDAIKSVIAALVVTGGWAALSRRS